MERHRRTYATLALGRPLFVTQYLRVLHPLDRALSLAEPAEGSQLPSACCAKSLRCVTSSLQSCCCIAAPAAAAGGQGSGSGGDGSSGSGRGPNGPSPDGAYGDGGSPSKDGPSTNGSFGKDSAGVRPLWVNHAGDAS